ncbi:MAG: YiiX/YebB-like N1pC/P60 family cysteine hydrolase [Bdellovibrionales bacterium]
MFSPLLNFIGRILARYLNKTITGHIPIVVYSTEELAGILRPGDILLVEGNLRVSVAIKYITQSTWSHAAIFVGDRLKSQNENGEPLTLIEADVQRGVVAVPISKYCCFQTRICRPVGLTMEDCERVVDFAVSRLGDSYDLKNVIDLARYLLPTPPVPTRWRRRLLALGCGEPTMSICSTLIAQAFQSVRYPILPIVTHGDAADPKSREILHIRHHSLFAPRDFDLSPYFQIIKPALALNFNYKNIIWGDLNLGSTSSDKGV